MLHAVGYSLREAAVELWRNRLVNVVSIGTIAVSLFILGVFATVTANLGGVLRGWSERVEVSVYLADEIDAAEREAIAGALAKAPEVDAFAFVSKRDAIERFRTYFPELETLPQLLERNPLPASFEVRIAPDYRSPEAVRAFAARLAGRPGIEDIDYDLLWIERLTTVLQLTQALGLFIGGALVVASVFTIFNVIKLTVYGRQDEIGIMRLVGATHGYIRGPFLVEGMLQGGLGGLVALGLLYATHELFVRRALEAFDLVAVTDWVRFLSPAGWLAIVVGGMIVGLVGSTLSVRRFLASPV